MRSTKYAAAALAIGASLVGAPALAETQQPVTTDNTAIVAQQDPQPQEENKGGESYWGLLGLIGLLGLGGLAKSGGNKSSQGSTTNRGQPGQPGQPGR